MATAKHVVRIDDESKKVVAAIAKKHKLSHSQATDWLVRYAHRRLETLRKNAAKAPGDPAPRRVAPQDPRQLDITEAAAE